MCILFWGKYRQEPYASDLPEGGIRKLRLTVASNQSGGAELESKDHIGLQ